MKLSKLANQYLCDLPIYEPGRPISEVARELDLDPKRFIKLASNENPLGPSKESLAAMKKALSQVHFYPDGSGYYLRKALAEKHLIQMENIMLGNGSNEILELLYHVFVEPNDDVIVGDRAFIIYSILATMFQANCLEIPFKHHTHDLNAMLRAITHRTKLVFVANPNNPTGTRVTNLHLERFIRKVPSHVVVVLDEAYYEYLEDPPQSIRWALSHNVVVLRTFSKIVGLAGLRIGYAIAQTECIKLLQKVRQPFSVNAIAQAGAFASLNDHAHMSRTRSLTRRGINYLEKEFRRRNLEYVPSEANFVLVKVGDGNKIFQSLQRKGVIVRPMAGYKMPEWIRVSIGLPEENKKFILALDKELAGS